MKDVRQSNQGMILKIFFLFLGEYRRGDKGFFFEVMKKIQTTKLKKLSKLMINK